MGTWHSPPHIDNKSAAGVAGGQSADRLPDFKHSTNSILNEIYSMQATRLALFDCLSKLDYVDSNKGSDPQCFPQSSSTPLPDTHNNDLQDILARLVKENIELNNLLQHLKKLVG